MPRHLSCMPRLGIWGAETSSFATVGEFLEEFGSSQAASTMELVSTELASRGAFVSRRLSYAGTQFELLSVPLTPEQRTLHARLCKWFVELFDTRLFDHKDAGSIYWGAHLRFFKALLVGFRVGAVGSRAKDHLASGGQVVISLTSTGEAASNRVEEVDVDEGGFVALRATLVSSCHAPIPNPTILTHLSI